MKQFSKKEQRKFWGTNEESFKSDVISDTVLLLSRKYIGKNVIDIGAGSGALIRSLKKQSKHRKIIGIDLVPKSKKVRKGDCTNLNFKSNYFDTCFCIDVIEHLSNSDLSRCLNEISRVLKRNGYAILTTLNNENLAKSIVVCPECSSRFHRWGHCQIFTEQRIREIFKKRGFAVVKLKKVNLDLLTKLKLLSKILYLFRIDRILKFDFLNRDLFFVLKKEREL